MIETRRPYTKDVVSYVVVRSYPWADRGYAQANPDWLAWGLVSRRVYFESENAMLSDEVAARWYDTLDDATWFVHEVDAVALALIVDGRVLPAHQSEHHAGWGHDAAR